MKNVIRMSLTAAVLGAAFALPAAPAQAYDECFEGTALPPCTVCYEFPTPVWERCVLVGLGPIHG